MQLPPIPWPGTDADAPVRRIFTQPDPTNRTWRGPRSSHGHSGRGFAVAGGIATLLLVGWLDHLTGPEFPMGVAYVIPVLIIAWLVGLPGAVVMAAAAGGVSLIAASPGTTLDTRSPAFWAAILRVAILIVIAMGASLARRRVQTAQETADAQGRRVADLSAEKQRYETLFHAVAHDVRGPLTTIMGMSLTLQRTAAPISEEERDLLGRIASSAERLNVLLEDLLSLDRSSSPLLEGGSSGSLGLLARRLCREMPALEGRQVKIEAGDEACAVEASVVERMLENLLRNILIHTPPDTRIWIRTWREGTDVLLAVEDDGSGIRPEERTTIFQPHRQGTGAEGGFGLGLAMVSSFAELYGGEAWVQDREGGGSSFRVKLPAAGNEARASTAARSSSTSAERHAAEGKGR